MFCFLKSSTNVKTQIRKLDYITTSGNKLLRLSVHISQAMLNRRSLKNVGDEEAKMTIWAQSDFITASSIAKMILLSAHTLTTKCIVPLSLPPLLSHPPPADWQVICFKKLQHCHNSGVTYVRECSLVAWQHFLWTVWCQLKLCCAAIFIFIYWLLLFPWCCEEIFGLIDLMLYSTSA